MNHNQDADHLRLLSIFHYIIGGMIGLFSLFPMIHLVVGISILTGDFEVAQPNGPPPAVIGWLFILMPLVFIVLGLAMAICIIVAGRKMNHRTGHLFCLVVAGVECWLFPFGTILGVLTILVLMRPSVKVLFDLPDEPDSAIDG